LDFSFLLFEFGTVDYLELRYRTNGVLTLGLVVLRVCFCMLVVIMLVVVATVVLF